MSDLVVAQIRTYVPMGVGAVLGWLASRHGILVDEQSAEALKLGTAGLAGAVWYGVARLLERIWPQAGVMLGVRRQPTYAPTTTSLDDVTLTVQKWNG